VFGVTEESAAATLREFVAAEHTLETVGVARGVTFVNDTKATTVDAVRAALETFDAPILLLAGGVYKGGDLSTLAGLVGSKVKAVGLYGSSREKFEQAWAGCAPMSYDTTMEEAARRLMDKAAAGDVMLLAPATSSFDQYANYRARGEDFRRIYSLLAGE
jgi:UDP-N-acetylmuramoylalanine--D-glutamate ligase